MALIIEAKITAGPTIEETIRECVEFAARNHCSVKTEINDIPMLISYGSNFTNHPGRPYSIQDCTDFFVEVYHEYCKAANRLATFTWGDFTQGESK